jgi:hypothetical protein
MNISLFWDVKPYSFVNICQRFGETCCLHCYFYAVNMVAAVSDWLVNICQTTRCQILEDCNLRTHHH